MDAQGTSEFFSLDSGMKCLTLGGDVPNLQSNVSGSNLVMCPLCSLCKQITNEVDRDVFLNHLLNAHSLVISYVNSVANLQRYMDYWRKRFQEVSYQSVCTVVSKGSCSTGGAAVHTLFLLDGEIPEDSEIRKKLQQERLSQVLLLQEEERKDTTFSRECLFCKKHFFGSRFSLFQHLIADHHLHIGAPDNIVFGNEFLDVLEEKLKNLQCFYCEKVFKDWGTLKEHMRKKQHKRINPKNKTYDKFYLVNYLEMGKTWEDVQNEDDNNSDGEDREEIELMDCQEERNCHIVCLFCESTRADLEKIVLHMKDAHSFDFHGCRSSLNLDFYQQVKLINYIRKQVHDNGCTFCDDVFSCYNDLMKHMMETGHVSLFPDSSKWDQPMYYFPTYENDNFLCALEDPAEDTASLVEPVVPEDAMVPKLSFLCDEQLRNSLM